MEDYTQFYYKQSFFFFLFFFFLEKPISFWDCVFFFYISVSTLVMEVQFVSERHIMNACT